ncbi:transcriptional regulator, ROK family [Myxococcus xanthus DK 1622]|uniref:Transcriptional regulator, ROK family n=2 Tax=Myxococcus TaxID=32 RepID=Q1CY52_MYXXD|nr:MULTISPECIES: ROK family transcriptional regulator [Myxococcus]ABF87082.1 transcriptional regulator, ROK family [Myxococcus xanthus DK 1622]NOJ56847.1 ROK family transcriptional regulator [Myxococcus xanthus]QPM78879.1 ROK family transcriptional regulator [Myxococcus xanthus]QQR43775.1 ROK family transcriptional regulator [Myxococcus xanthus]QVW67949.1 ROK family transcriptional regulator [Myxococcus xanthus DZ2]
MRVGTAVTTVDAAGMRAQNSSLLLNMIWRERQISRAEIARRTELSPSTVSAIVADLERSGLVRSIGAGVSRGGRRPTLIGFCDDAFSLIGVEMGATHVTAALTDLRGRVRAYRHASHAVREDPKGTLQKVRELVQEVLDAERVPRRSVAGMGIAVPSPVHPSAPGKLSPLLVPAWRDYDVQESLRSAFGLPVFVDNDANLGALSECYWGAGVNGEDLAYIKLATGIGSGHIIHGDVYRGAGGTAGEISHMAVDSSGPQCVCGLRGCLVTLIGSAALLERARELMGRKDKRALTVRELVEGARAGEPAARQVIDGLGHYLGIAVAGLLNLLNPAIVVLGGEISSVGDLLLDPLRASVRKRALSTSMAETRIVTSALGDRAIAVGAATLVLQAALRDRTLFPLQHIGKPA